jgi:hypothetical protein
VDRLGSDIFVAEMAISTAAGSTSTDGSELAACFKLKLYWVQLEFPDSRWSIEASLDAQSPSVLAVLVACDEQSVIRDELCLGKGDVGSVGRRATRYGYGPHGWGDVAPRRRVDGVAVRRPPHDEDRRRLSPNVALA